jgi:class 3 adenylate cyclase
MVGGSASRVEEATRQTGDDVLVTQATCALLTRDSYDLVERPSVELKGRTEQVRLVAPLVGRTERTPADEAEAQLSRSGSGS